jgi:AcrR family transcriptional regulator
MDEATRTTPRGASPATGRTRTRTRLAVPSRHGPRDEAPRGGTRERIQAVALELFAEQGYEKTSLREVAERLGVTKAALYYHFKSKEDIVRSFTEDYRAEIEAVIAWGASQPPTSQTRAELLARYADIVTRRLGVIRFMQQNQATMHTLLSGARGKIMFREQFRALCDLLAPPGSPLPERVRAAMAVVSVSMTPLLFLEEAASPEELHAVMLGVASELADAKAP